MHRRRGGRALRHVSRRRLLRPLGAMRLALRPRRGRRGALRGHLRLLGLELRSLDLCGLDRGGRAGPHRVAVTLVRPDPRDHRDSDRHVALVADGDLALVLATVLALSGVCEAPGEPGATDHRKRGDRAQRDNRGDTDTPTELPFSHACPPSLWTTDTVSDRDAAGESPPLVVRDCRVNLGSEGVEENAAGDRVLAFPPGRRSGEREPCTPRARIHAQRTPQIRASVCHVPEPEPAWPTPTALPPMAEAFARTAARRAAAASATVEEIAGVGGRAVPDVTSIDATASRVAPPRTRERSGAVERADRLGRAERTRATASSSVPSVTAGSSQSQSRAACATRAA